ncbi:MAG TPA: ABC transporter ATP-binding protein [Kofleriaceae bacterium]
MAEINLRSIAHSYDGGKSWALHELDLRWRDGGAYALLGPSGCGKTTLLGIISGLIQPTRGAIEYAGVDVTRRSSRDRNIAQVFQFPVVYDTMTVRDNLAFPLRNRGLPAAEITRRVERIADALELTDVLAQRATRLTADQKQILSLGRGLVREDVAAILFDEPLTVIDPHRKWRLRRKLKEIHKQFRHTLIYVTHDQTEALTFADEVVVMQTGEVLQRGTPEQLFRRPEHTYVGYFIGSPGMNVLPCTLADGGTQVRIGAHAIALGAAVEPAAGALELGIRPEHLMIVARGPDAHQAPSLPATVTAIEDHGRFHIVTARFADHKLKLRVARGSEPPPAVGEHVALGVPAAQLCLYRDHKIIAPAEPGAPAA